MSACHSLGSDLGVWDTLKLKKEKRKKTEAIRPWEESWGKESHSAILVWVPERARNRKRELQFERCSPCEEIKWKIVRVWESEKGKGNIFFLFKLHVKKINWWSSHEVFKCYNYGELEYLKEDFTTSFVMRLYLLLKIYLLYIQFIVDIFRSYPIAIPSISKGFSCKI